MFFRAIICCTALVLGLLASLNASAAPACNGVECPPPAKSKPLNIMQFMREQAASTRAANPEKRQTRATSRNDVKAKRSTHRAIAARPKSAPQPPAEVSAKAQPEPQVQVVGDNELNAIDRAAGATAPPETVGAGAPSENNVRFVDADEFNDIDRKADERALLAMVAARNAAATMSPEKQQSAPQTSVSWLSWLWSGVANTFAALATAVHNLIG